MLALSDVSLTAWGRPFLAGASLSVPAGAKAGLVGRNGAGKSTLFRLLMGELSAQGGTVTLPKGRTVAVEQEHAATAQPLVEAVLAADTVRAGLLLELDAAPPERLGELHARLIDIGADAAPARAAEILTGLGFRQAELSRPVGDFSGGWRMRAALAGALLAEPDLLLLDEPTNYLDLEGALWLEARLKRYPRTAVIISHDRELLNGSCDMIVHLTEGRLDAYQGGYDQFERQRGERLRLASAQRVKQEAERAHLQSFVDRFRATASKASQAQSRLKRLAKLEPVAVALDERVAPFRLPSPERALAPPLVRLENASVGYDGPGRSCRGSTCGSTPTTASASWASTARASPPSPSCWPGRWSRCPAGWSATGGCAWPGSTSTRSRRSTPPRLRWTSSAASCPSWARRSAARACRSSAWAPPSRRPPPPTCRAASARGCCSTWWPWTGRTC